MEEWTCGNPKINKFIKVTICKPVKVHLPFEGFKDIKKLVKMDGFDGKSEYYENDDGNLNSRLRKIKKVW
ncbi:kinase-like domain-containing protein [Rhizophagus irregularis DAOM 181602=DAOM 197198]|uniref:Uncharacterized protein n=1 Tax=Rhizophagus irregularis (strain DAOM 181602 / DAOM 197198 / MUCL 43194) TaxID=747089 RepID=U9TEB8_RHIID|nr:kinase-like domain-containing protein [Rhizophagus irregularis DAOM 181602=DAOM 197198]